MAVSGVTPTKAAVCSVYLGWVSLEDSEDVWRARASPALFVARDTELRILFRIELRDILNPY